MNAAFHRPLPNSCPDAASRCPDVIQPSCKGYCAGFNAICFCDGYVLLIDLFSFLFLFPLPLPLPLSNTLLSPRMVSSCYTACANPMETAAMTTRKSA